MTITLARQIAAQDMGHTREELRRVVGGLVARVEKAEAGFLAALGGISSDSVRDHIRAEYLICEPERPTPHTAHVEKDVCEYVVRFQEGFYTVPCLTSERQTGWRMRPPTIGEKCPYCGKLIEVKP